MLPEYDIQKIETVLADFHRATGVTITYYTTDFVGISAKGTRSSEYCKLISSTAEGSRACGRSNNAILSKCKSSKRPEKHICAAGLVDIAIPLLDGDEILGYLMLGQLRVDDTLPKSASNFPVDHIKLTEHFSCLQRFDEDAVSSIMNLASMLTKYIMLEKMIRPKISRSADAILDFIEKHLKEKLTVDVIAKGVHLSPSGVYKCVKQTFDCTVGSLVTKRRIARSLPLLEKGKLSIEEVADAVGFTDAAYFSRRFKKKMGVSPLKYRKSKNNKG